MVIVKGAGTFVTQSITESAHTCFRVGKVSQVERMLVPLHLTPVVIGHLAMGTIVAVGHGVGYCNP